MRFDCCALSCTAGGGLACATCAKLSEAAAGGLGNTTGADHWCGTQNAGAKDGARAGEEVEPEDIADAAIWLASDESRYVTASRVAVDLGSTQF